MLFRSTTAPPRSQHGPPTDGGASLTGSENKHSAWSGGSTPSQRPGGAGHASSLIGDGAISELAYATSRRCRCGTLLLYRTPELRGSGFRITAVNCSGAMGIRTPDLLHAIQRQPVHRSPSAQVTVPASTQQSTGIQTRCGTSLLYGPMPPTACSSAESCSGQRREIPRYHDPDFTHLPM